MTYRKWPLYNNRTGDITKGYKTSHMIGTLTLNKGQVKYNSDILYSFKFSIDGSQSRYVIASSENSNSAVEMFNTANSEYTMVIRSDINVYQTIDSIPCMPGADITVDIWLNRQLGYEDQVIVEVNVDTDEGHNWNFESIRSGSFSNRWDYFFDTFYLGQSGLAFTEVTVGDHVFLLNTIGSDMQLINTNFIGPINKYFIQLSGDPYSPDKLLG